MNFFKYIKSKITPKAIEKIIHRTVKAYYSGYPGTERYGNGSKYPGGITSSGLVTTHDHYQLRQNIRDLMYDSMECRALVNSNVDTSVYTGLHLKPTPNPDILNIDPETLEQWAEKTASSFNLWAKSKKSNRSETNNFYQNQRLYMLFQERDNDMFARFYYSREKNLINPLQIEFVDPNQISGYGYTTTYMQYNQEDGIVRDGQGREIGYKYWSQDATGKMVETYIPRVGEKSGRIMMIHGYNPEYAGQYRGYPKMSHLIQELSNLTTYKISILQKAINQASMIAAVENDQQDASQPLEGRSAPIRDYGYDDNPPETDSGLSDEDPIINWNTTPEATIRQPGSILLGNLRRGDKLKYLQDTAPSTSFDMFTTAIFASICASTGDSAEVVLKKFGANYSASRATLILTWRTAQIRCDEMAADFLDPVYEMWLSEEIAAGRISAPGWNDPLLRAAWLSCEWAGAPMPNIDPNATAKADQMYIEMGAQTPDDVARNLNGSSGKANRAKNARQLQELSPVPWSKGAAQTNTEEQNNG